ncbi:MAG: FecR domain-containing protein [Burkholderiales bacterium]
MPSTSLKNRRLPFACSVAFFCAVAGFAFTARADDIARFKVVTGSVHVERSGQRIPVLVGTRLQSADTVVTGANGSAGITFVDNSLLSVGPNSVLAIERYAFNSTTHEGSFESSLRKGTLSVVSGKIAKQSPDAMKVRTPSSILGVRGTEFLVRTGN